VIQASSTDYVYPCEMELSDIEYSFPSVGGAGFMRSQIAKESSA